MTAARIIRARESNLLGADRVVVGHSHGRDAGSAWYADEFALDLERNCICHVNCDSPGAATLFEDVYWMAEVEASNSPTPRRPSREEPWESSLARRL